MYQQWDYQKIIEPNQAAMPQQHWLNLIEGISCKPSRNLPSNVARSEAMDSRASLSFVFDCTMTINLHENSKYVLMQMQLEFSMEYLVQNSFL